MIFKDNYDFETRKSESNKILNTYEVECLTYFRYPETSLNLNNIIFKTPPP